MSEYIEINYISDMFRRYMKANNLKFKDLEKTLHCSGQNISRLLDKPQRALTIGQIFDICGAVGCTKKDLIKAFTQAYEDYANDYI